MSRVHLYFYFLEMGCHSTGLAKLWKIGVGDELGTFRKGNELENVRGPLEV